MGCHCCSGDAGFPSRGSIVAIVTPFTSKGQCATKCCCSGNSADDCVDTKVLRNLVKLHKDSNTTAIVPCGTTGEAPTLSAEDFEAIISTVTDEVKGSCVKVIAGTGSNSTKKAVEMTARAKELGVDACLIVTPYYNKPSPEGLIAHFRELNNIGIPLILYNVPGRTCSNVEPRTIIQIAESCENVVGVKAANGDLEQITQTIVMAKSLGRPLAVLSGDDALTLPIMSVGGTGVISVAANIIPKVMSNLVSSFQVGDWQTSQTIMQAIHQFCVSLLKLGPNPTPIKGLMNRVGLEVGTCRLPLTDLSSEVLESLVRIAREMRNTLRAADLECDTTLDNL